MGNVYWGPVMQWYYVGGILSPCCVRLFWEIKYFHTHEECALTSLRRISTHSVWLMGSHDVMILYGLYCLSVLSAFVLGGSYGIFIHRMRVHLYHCEECSPKLYGPLCITTIRTTLHFGKKCTGKPSRNDTICDIMSSPCACLFLGGVEIVPYIWGMCTFIP